MQPNSRIFTVCELLESSAVRLTQVRYVPTANSMQLVLSKNSRSNIVGFSIDYLEFKVGFGAQLLRRGWQADIFISIEGA